MRRILALWSTVACLWSSKNVLPDVLVRPGDLGWKLADCTILPDGCVVKDFVRLDNRNVFMKDVAFNSFLACGSQGWIWERLSPKHAKSQCAWFG